MIKITFSGDIMLKPKVLNYYYKEKNNNYNTIFENVKCILKNSDFVVGNLETPISSDETDYKSETYRFTSPIEFAQAVKNANFNLVTTANNHCLDNDKNGIDKTIQSLKDINLNNTGISSGKVKPYIVNINKYKFAFLSYTYGTNAFNNNVYLNKKDLQRVNLFQNQELSNPITRFIYKNNFILVKVIRKIFRKLHLLQLNKPVFERREFSFEKIKELKKDIRYCKENKVDYTIMCMHAGGQYNSFPTKYTQKIVKLLKKNGVDMIIGNHEHVVQKCEIKDNTLTAYCLGNFVGTAGVIDKPFDKMAEYSILIHTYFNKEKNKVILAKATFSILKTVLESEYGKYYIKVVPLYNYIKNCKNNIEKKKLIDDYNKICKIVLNSNDSSFELKEEIEIIN